MTPVMLATPTDNGPSPMPLFTDVRASSPTSPVIVPAVVEVTVTFTVAAVPCVIAAGDVDPLTVRVVVVAWEVPTARGHCVALLSTFTGPKTNARSYTVSLVHTGVVAAAAPNNNTLAFAVLLVQLLEIPA